MIQKTPVQKRSWGFRLLGQWLTLAHIMAGSKKFMSLGYRGEMIEKRYFGGRGYETFKKIEEKAHAEMILAP